MYFSKYPIDLEFIVSPDGAIIAACHCKRLGGVDSESPQFALTVTLHDEEGLVAVVDHHLEDLAVLRAHQDVISPPAHTAHGQPYQKTRTRNSITPIKKKKGSMQEHESKQTFANT